MRTTLFVVENDADRAQAKALIEKAQPAQLDAENRYRLRTARRQPEAGKSIRMRVRYGNPALAARRGTNQCCTICVYIDSWPRCC